MLRQPVLPSIHTHAPHLVAAALLPTAPPHHPAPPPAPSKTVCVGLASPVSTEMNRRALT